MTQSSNVTAASDFSIEFRVDGGSDVGGGLSERRQVLVLDAAQGTGFLETHRFASDEGGMPIGTFRASLAPAFFVDLRARAARAAFDRLPPASAGGPGTSVLRIAIRENGRTRETSFTNRDIDILEALDDVIQPLERTVADLHASPEAAVRLHVQVKTGDAARFLVRIENVGTQPVLLADPRGLPGRYVGVEEAMLDDDPNRNRWAGVRIAEYPPEEPGVTAPPLEWVRISLEPSASGSTSPIDLVPGRSFEAETSAWSEPVAGRRYLVQAVLSDYVGAAGPGSSYRLRGAALSTAIEHTPR